MILQTIDGITFRMKEKYDFGFLSRYGRVFKVFDDQDSGNICFGTSGAQGRLFLKFAGAPTAEYSGTAEDAVTRLRSTVKIYEELRHDMLINYRGCEDTGGGFMLIFDWTDGECMGRMYEESHKKIMALSAEEKLGIFAAVTDFLKSTAAQGYTAIDFYDGSIMYDTETKKTTICDIDFFRRQPAVNDMGRMWGSERFMSPEEYKFGAPLDEITNVFTLGQTGFSLFTDSCREREVFPLSDRCYEVLKKATSADRNERYSTIAEMEKDWKAALDENDKER